MVTIPLTALASVIVRVCLWQKCEEAVVAVLLWRSRVFDCAWVLRDYGHEVIVHTAPLAVLL